MKMNALSCVYATARPRNLLRLKVVGLEGDSWSAQGRYVTNLNFFTLLEFLTVFVQSCNINLFDLMNAL